MADVYVPDVDPELGGATYHHVQRHRALRRGSGRSVVGGLLVIFGPNVLTMSRRRSTAEEGGLVD